MFQTDFYKVYIGYASGVIQCILRDILKGILLVKYKVLHPGKFGRFRVHGNYLESRCVLYMGVVEIRSCFISILVVILCYMR